MVGFCVHGHIIILIQLTPMIIIRSTYLYYFMYTGSFNGATQSSYDIMFIILNKPQSPPLHVYKYGLSFYDSIASYMSFHLQLTIITVSSVHVQGYIPLNASSEFVEICLYIARVCTCKVHEFEYLSAGD